MSPRARWLIRALVVVGASLALGSACDDAILGVRTLDCDGGSCMDADRPDRPGDEDSRTCPPVDSPTCDAGAPVEQREGDCIVGYVCEVTCASRGGTCATLASCAGGRWSPDASTDCSSGLGCCRPCPAIMAPPADYCDGGTIAEVREGDCVVGFSCP